jgi:hypothetical protein
MDRSHHSMYGIMHQDWNTVRRPHRHHHAWLIGHQCVPSSGKSIGWRQRTIHHKCFRSMNLLHRQRPGCGSCPGYPLSRNTKFKIKPGSMLPSAKKVPDPISGIRKCWYGYE